MHDCSKFEGRLVDLVFDEVETNDRLRLMAEIENCSDCLGEYRSLTGTLVVFDHAVEAALPDESFWPEHHEALRLRLEKFAHSAQEKRAPLWRRLFTAKLPVPVPVAAVIVLAFLVAAVFALSPSTRERAQTLAAQPSIINEAPPRYIEVPVIQEKVVTRVVYIEKKMGGKTDLRHQSPSFPSTAPNSDTVNQQDGMPARASLAGFQPPDEMRIRVIRRSNSDED